VVRGEEKKRDEVVGVTIDDARSIERCGKDPCVHIEFGEACGWSSCLRHTLPFKDPSPQRSSKGINDHRHHFVFITLSTRRDDNLTNDNSSLVKTYTRKIQHKMPLWGSSSPSPSSPSYSSLDPSQASSDEIKNTFIKQVQAEAAMSNAKALISVILPIHLLPVFSLSLRPKH
jgi:hypothetical protein